MVNSRQSNLELLRICCMLMIVAGHIVLYHKTPYALTSIDNIIKLSCLSFFSVAVNAFVLISGYFGIKFKTDRFVRLIFQTIFYSSLLMCLSVIIGWHTFNIKKDLFAFFPIITKQYWFVTSYIVLYLISPWLNIWIDGMGKKVYKRFLAIGFLIVYLWPTFSYLFNTLQFIGDSGYGIVNFVYLYLLGRYINIHYQNSHSTAFYLKGYMLSVTTLFASQFFLSWMLGFKFSSWISYNTIFIFFGSLFLFMCFMSLNLQSRVVNYWAKPCLAVYLIHMNPYIWDNFCKHIELSSFHGITYLLLIFVLPLVTYIFCASIEILRSRITAFPENKMIAFIKAFEKQFSNRV